MWYFLSFWESETKSKELISKKRVYRQRLSEDVSFFSSQIGEGLGVSSWLSVHGWSQVTPGSCNVVCDVLKSTSVRGRGFLFWGAVLWAHQAISTTGVLKQRKKWISFLREEWETKQQKMRGWTVKRQEGKKHHSMGGRINTRQWETRLGLGNGIWVCMTDWVKIEFGRAFWTTYFSLLSILGSRVNSSAPYSISVTVSTTCWPKILLKQ